MNMNRGLMVLAQRKKCWRCQGISGWIEKCLWKQVYPIYDWDIHM